MGIKCCKCCIDCANYECLTDIGTCYNCFCEGYDYGYPNCCGNLFDMLTCGLFDCSRICNRCFDKEPPDDDSYDYLCRVIKAKRYRIAERIINGGVDINSRTKEPWLAGCSLLNCSDFDAEQVLWVLDHKCDVNQRIERDGHTAIFNYASVKSCLELLVSRGADINALNNRGETAIKYLCRKADPIVGIKNLVELGASLSIPNNTLKDLIEVCEYDKVIDDNGEESIMWHEHKARRAETKAYLLNLQAKENSLSVNRL